MEIKELRVGSLLKHGNDEVHVFSIHFEDRVEISCDGNNSGESNYIATVDSEKLTPIPLTEDWLIKFGFEKTKENEYFIDKHTVLLGVKLDPLVGKTRAIVYRNASVGVMPICLYVHQLQNLFFALSGEELECR